MASENCTYRSRVNFDRERMGLDSFNVLPTYSLEDVVSETFPDRKHTDERRIYPHVEWLATSTAGLDNRNAMTWTMRVWRDTLLELGYTVDTMVAVFRIRQKEVFLAHPGHAFLLERARRAMEEAMEIPVPPPSPSTSMSSPATTEALVVIIISDDEEGEIFQARKTGTCAESESGSEDWRGLILGSSKSGELPHTNTMEQPAGPYVCKRCSLPGHFIQDCPTNLDPAYDLLPPPGYRCALCSSKQHFITACPRNTRPDSMTQQRISAGILPRSDLYLDSTTTGVKMAKENSKDVSGGARAAPSLSGTSENRTIGNSRDRSHSGSVRRRTASPSRDRNRKQRSRSPLRDRANKGKTSKAGSRTAPSNLRDGGRTQGSAQNRYELSYDDEPMDEGRDAIAPQQDNSNRNLLLPTRHQAEGRLSFHDEGDNHAFGEPKRGRGRASARDRGESPVFIKSRKATGRLSFSDYDEDEVEEVEMEDFSSASKACNRGVSHHADSSNDQMAACQSEKPKPLSFKTPPSTMALHPQRQNLIEQAAKKPIAKKTGPNSASPALQEQNIRDNRLEQVVEKPVVCLPGSGTMAPHPERQGLIDGNFAPATHKSTIVHELSPSSVFQSQNQGIHPDRLNFIKSRLPQVDSQHTPAQALGPIWNPDGTYNHVRNPDPEYGNHVADWIHSVVDEFLEEHNITMPEPSVPSAVAKPPAKKAQVPAQLPGWMNEKTKKAPGTMKSDLLAAIARKEAESTTIEKREEPPTSAATKPEENPNMAKARDLLKCNPDVNNCKKETRSTAIEMWDESDCSKPEVNTDGVQGHNEETSMVGTESSSAGVTNSVPALRSIEGASDVDFNMETPRRNSPIAGNPRKALENGNDKAADESATMGSIEAVSQPSLSQSPPTMPKGSPTI
ncbi:hypothetical protein B0T14DRAFT_579992 [Immersiella caudata]|uniref:CCHC-type domain-containing protein n=1 Tax=Immersiella caudata TaxID=314043 RepID=A0AA39X5L6_9PEZI|nr:hypothetical protein B0T14DRAFT_579992 [Immersiella caudata]